MSTFKPLVGILGDVDGRIVPGPTSFVLDECPLWAALRLLTVVRAVGRTGIQTAQGTSSGHR
jgi:hypothetical protein